MSANALGRIRAVSLVCPALEVAIAAYRDHVGYHVVEQGLIPPVLAAAWGAPEAAGLRFAVLGPASGAETYLRFIEVPAAAPYPPYSAHGWNAIEITVQDCDAAVAQLARGPFRVVGPPEDLAFSAGALRAGQLVGPLGEIVYLTQVRRQMPGFDLPPAQCPVDRVFIVVLHGPEAAPGLAHYTSRYGNPASDTFDVTVPFMARYQGLPADAMYRIGTLVLDAGFYLELDNSPPHIGPRAPGVAGLPPGIAMVTFETQALPGADALVGGPVYGGRSTTRVTGAFGEWIELLSAPT